MSISFSPVFLQGLAPYVPAQLLEEAASSRFEPEESLSRLIKLSRRLQKALHTAGAFDQAAEVASYILPRITELTDETISKESRKTKRTPTIEDCPGKRFKTQVDTYSLRKTILSEPNGAICDEAEVKPMGEELSASDDRRGKLINANRGPLRVTPNEENSQDEVCSMEVEEEQPPQSRETIPFSVPQGPREIQSPLPLPVLPGDWENMGSEEVKWRVMALRAHKEAAEALDRFRLLEVQPRETVRMIETAVRNLLASYLSYPPGEVSAHPDVVAALLSFLYVKNMKDHLVRLTGSDTAFSIVREITEEQQKGTIFTAAHLLSSRIHDKYQAIRRELPSQVDGDIRTLLEEIRAPHLI